MRKGVKNEKDVFVEVWSSHVQGLVSSLKVTDKLTKVFNDVVFGGIAWSKDETKITFIGEAPEIASYKNPFDIAVEEESKKTDEDKKDDEHWQEEKFLYKTDFGEMLVGKKGPAIFVFDLKENTLN